MRKFIYKSLEEQITNNRGELCYKHSWERGLLEKVNKKLVANFNKVAKWIEENCPNLNSKFSCSHDPYYWIQLVVENGKAYLEYGSHGYDYELAMSTTESATFLRGSNQCTAYAYDGIQFFRNNALEEFLKEWGSIKERVILENRAQSLVFSDNFEA